MPRDYRSNGNIVFSCQYHVIWCTKYRRPVLDDEIATRLNEILHEVAGETQAIIIEAEIMPDHVQLLIDCEPMLGVYKVIKRMKGRSSRLLRAEYPRVKSRLPTLWTNSVCILTSGGATVEVIRKYIKDQKGR